MKTFRYSLVLLLVALTSWVVIGHSSHLDFSRSRLDVIPQARAAVKERRLEEKKVMIDRTFTVDSRGTLDVQVPDADVFVETGSTRQAGVQVILMARDMKKATEYYESLHIKVVQQGDQILVTAKPPRSTPFHYMNNGNARILIKSHVPVTFSASLKTSDGDVSLGRLEGAADVKTSDGDIQVSELMGTTVSLRTSDGDISGREIKSPTVIVQTSDGDINVTGIQSNEASIQTSDGDIQITKLNGATRVVTSDGNISLGYVEGETLSARTSDGNITIRELNVRTSEVHSSDGDIDIGRASGRIQSTVSSGDIHLALGKPSGVIARTSDGDVVIQAPTTLAADLKLRGEHVRLSSSYKLKGRVNKERIEGSVNGGGPVIEASTSGGVVTFQPL